jgi:hypothetical protein
MMGGTCRLSSIGKVHILIGSLEGKKPRHRWEDNIKMDSKERCLSIGIVAASSEHSNGPTCFIKSGDFLDQLIGYQLLKDSVELVIYGSVCCFFRISYTRVAKLFSSRIKLH